MVAQAWERLKTFAKTVVRARSVRAAYLLHTPHRRMSEIRLPNYGGTFRFRTGTSDAQLLRSLITPGTMQEYTLPAGMRPRTILDIGANIGTTAALLARTYPHARIWAFEPLPDNAELLRHNIASFPLVTPVSYGLGARSERLPYMRSDDPRNFGGGGFHGNVPGGEAKLETLPVVAVPEALAQLGIAEVDVIKIDTEGAEHDILTSFPTDVLDSVQVIVGELHGKPRDGALLDYLERWFDVSCKSVRGKPKWFRALRRAPGATAVSAVREDARVPHPSGVGD